MMTSQGSTGTSTAVRSDFSNDPRAWGAKEEGQVYSTLRLFQEGSPPLKSQSSIARIPGPGEQSSWMEPTSCLPLPGSRGAQLPSLVTRPDGTAVPRFVNDPAGTGATSLAGLLSSQGQLTRFHHPLDRVNGSDMIAETGRCAVESSAQQSANRAALEQLQRRESWAPSASLGPVTPPESPSAGLEEWLDRFPSRSGQQSPSRGGTHRSMQEKSSLPSAAASSVLNSGAQTPSRYDKSNWEVNLTAGSRDGAPIFSGNLSGNPPEGLHWDIGARGGRPVWS